MLFRFVKFMTEIITYDEMCKEENKRGLQKGMDFEAKSSYSLVLMSVKANSPYNDKMREDGTIEYEGHDIPSSNQHEKKTTDQPAYTTSGNLSQNGKFQRAAESYKQGKREPAKIKVYRKIKKGIWVKMGFYDLIDVFKESDGKRNVFKFLLEPNFKDFDPEIGENQDDVHRRYIPGDVMQEVYKRDKGKCVKCHSDKNLHYDHKIPFSLGGSSTDPKNIQILCGKHNLKKGNRLDY
uniref:Restriction endonuclease n=1 Tax=uncultured marine thaumarchaeote AD1000_11_E10 TaxID=1455890 RepID=A0A075FPK8_9ARCH|nr:restriction endonuclease [uncultured marine thaumarchaeote AD1000_11_E10]